MKNNQDIDRTIMVTVIFGYIFLAYMIAKEWGLF